MARIVGGFGTCVRPKAARPRWFARGTSVPPRLKTTVSSLKCRRGMAESTAEHRRFSGYDRPGPSRGAHPRCLRGGVAWLRRALCKHLPAPPRKIKKAIYEKHLIIKREKCDILVFLLGANIRYCSLSKKIVFCDVFYVLWLSSDKHIFCKTCTFRPLLCVIVVSWDYNFECLWSDNIQYRIIV